MLKGTSGRILLMACVACWGLASAQEPFNNTVLSGRYHFVQLLATPAPAETRTLGGTITFDGRGAYTYAAEGTSGGQGNYSVGAAGNVTLTSPIRAVDYLSAYLASDRDVLLGASTFAAGSTYDFFVAVRAPAASVTNALLNGAYVGAWLELAPQVRKSGLVSLAAAGNGQFSRVSVTGHASDAGGRSVTQSAANSSYTLRAGGSGTASFGAASSLLAGDREIFASEGGGYLLGHLTGRGVLLAARQAAGTAAFEGRYWMAELQVDGSAWSAAAGSLRALGAGRAVLSQRIRMDGRLLDYAGLNSYAVNPDGTGALAPRLDPRLANMALAAPGAFLGAQMGPLDASTTQYGIFLGVRAPAFQGSGVFVDPVGVVNGASFAGWPHPVAPGAVVSLFGSGLAARESISATHPLPTTKIDDVTVTINGTPAPLYFVSPGQISLQVPYGLKGNSVTVRVSNSRGASNEVQAPLAATSPGVFLCGDFRGCVSHADGSLVSPQNPARPGETVMIWLTGLGELSPTVPTGAAHPAAPLAWAAEMPISVLFGGEPSPRVQFAGGAPGFAGLNQINATIAVSAPVGASVPLAILTGNAYTDLVDIPISR